MGLCCHGEWRIWKKGFNEWFQSDLRKNLKIYVWKCLNLKLKCQCFLKYVVSCFFNFSSQNPLAFISLPFFWKNSEIKGIIYCIIDCPIFITVDLGCLVYRLTMLLRLWCFSVTIRTISTEEKTVIMISFFLPLK